VTKPSFSAGYLDNPAPRYPRLSQRIGEEGTVRLRVMVDAEGRPVEWAIEASSGHDRLDQAALDVIEEWRFTPAQRNGQPVAGEVIVPMRFRLR